MNPSEIKILLVDDEPDILELVGFHLRKEGYTVFTASGGKEGVEIARKEQPALIILDVMMPDMDGIRHPDGGSPSWKFWRALGSSEKSF